jgi:hypothetical protein
MRQFLYYKIASAQIRKFTIGSSVTLSSSKMNNYAMISNSISAKKGHYRSITISLTVASLRQKLIDRN